MTLKEYLHKYPSKAKEFIQGIDDPLLHQMVQEYARIKVKERDSFLRKQFEKHYPKEVESIRIASYKHAIEFCFENAPQPVFE